MKKVLAFLLAAAMALPLSACMKEAPVESGSSSTGSQSSGTSGESEELKPEEGAELKFWTADVDFGKAVAAEFEKEYGVPVTVEEAGLDAINKIMLDGPAGNGADLFMVAHDSFQTGYSAGVFKEIDSSIASKLNEELNEVAMKTATCDGKLYGVPISIETSVMFYNKDLVEEPAETFEQIVEEAKEWNDPDNNKFWFLTTPTSGYAVHPMLTPFGFELFGENGDAENPGFDTPEFLEGMKYLSTLKEAMPIDAENLGMDASSFLNQNFIDGKTAYYPNGPWLLRTLKEAGVNYGVCKLPTLNGNEMKPFAGVQNVHVSTYTKYPNAAQLFAQYLASEDAAALLYEKAAKITARKDVDSVPGLCDDEDMKVFTEQFSDSVPMPTSKRMSYFWTVSESVYSAVFDGTLTPEEGVEKAQKDFDALVQSE